RHLKRDDLFSNQDPDIVEEEWEDVDQYVDQNVDRNLDQQENRIASTCHTPES
ncbi:hypothetical protein AAF712_016019, partial [Marasmius tenuissimus]